MIEAFRNQIITFSKEDINDFCELLCLTKCGIILRKKEVEAIEVTTND